MSDRPTRTDYFLTGFFYLAMGVTGAVAFVGVRPMLFSEDSAAETLANFTSRQGLVRIGIALELATVILQALAAAWFARIFSRVDIAAALAVSLLGMVNAVAILASSTMLRVALDASLNAASVDPGAIHTLVATSGRFWDAGAIFFGLWLIPMGWLVLKSRIGPRALGWILIVGGLCYVANVFIAVLAPNAGIWVVALPLLATVGEFWMIGLLLWKGMRRGPREEAPA